MTSRPTISNSQLEDLASRVEALLQSKNTNSSSSNSLLLIAIAGVPGAGKTTLAQQLVAFINEKHPSESTTAIPFAVNVPMDGFHLPRSTLATMSDPDFAAERRGAFWTFDNEKLFAFLHQLKEANSSSSTTDNHENGGAVLARAPSFDHRLKDPVENDIPVFQGTRVLVMEGNYLALRNPPPTPQQRSDEDPHNVTEASSTTAAAEDTRKWRHIPSLFDLVVFVEIALEESTERVAKRHMAVWDVPRDVAMARASGSDFLNAKLIALTKEHADVVVQSVAW